MKKLMLLPLIYLITSIGSAQTPAPGGFKCR
jgi:hypothetical protein